MLLGFGAAKLFYPRFRVALRIPWIVLFLVSGACLDEAWGISYLLGRKVPVDIRGPGGLVGYGLSNEHHGLLTAALGPVGSVLLIVGVYLTTLILVTGLRPIHLVREMVNLTRRSVAKMRRMASASKNSEVGSERTTRRPKRNGEHSKRYRSNSKRKVFRCLKRCRHTDFSGGIGKSAGAESC